MSKLDPVLSVVIPALDEEEAIGETIRRCVEARAPVCRSSSVSEVEIIVVSDGSSDRTEQIAKSFPEVTVLAFERNRGYGAAIKCGFEHARGELVGFLDADGTCDPRFFADLCRALEDRQADVVLGSRVGPESEMPRVRRLGNTLFAWMLGVLSKGPVGDTASGMRVLRRSCLAALYPLPDGLHFTPAMSAKVLIDGRLRLAEVPMAYAERIGRSKLSVLRDGIRFFRVISQAALCYRPSRPLLLATGLLGALGLAVAAGPIATYLSHQHLEEWMIYRVLFASLMATMATISACAAIVAENIAAVVHDRPAAASGVTGAVARAFEPRWRRLLVPLLVATGTVVVHPGVVQYATSGHVEMHWSRAALASLLLVIAGVMITTTILLSMLDLVREQRVRTSGVRAPDRVRPSLREAA